MVVAALQMAALHCMHTDAIGRKECHAAAVLCP